MATVLTTRKSGNLDDISPLSRHITEWQNLSMERRDKVLGQNYLQDVEEFYCLSDQGSVSPSFRPTIRIPELQTLMLYEANDLSESSPRVYISDAAAGERDETREQFLQNEWRRSWLNYHIMFANLWSLFGGLGVLQVGLDPLRSGGRGKLWVKSRNPNSFHCDPTTDYDLEWSYIIFEDYMHLDEIRKRWPLTSVGLKQRGTSQPRSTLLGSSGTGLTMPDGPMSSVGGLPSNRVSPHDTRLRVRYCYCLDYTRMIAKLDNKELPGGAITDPDATPDLEWKYPNNRLLIECEGRILSDGDNPWPLGMFPAIPFWSMPPLFGVWGVPAVRYTSGLQNVSERLLTGVFENAVRLNNGIWFIKNNTGIDPEAFGGMPGEVVVINAQSEAPHCQFVDAMPAHFMGIPTTLLDRQKSIQGFTPARSGNPGAGNISADLFDDSVLRSQGLTQLRGRLAYFSIDMLAKLYYYSMCRFYTQKRMSFNKDTSEPIEWKPLELGMQGKPDAHDVEVDEASVTPLSQAVLRKMVPELMKNKVLSVRRGLQMLDFPHADEVAKEHEQELALEALARAKGTRR